MTSDLVNTSLVEGNIVVLQQFAGTKAMLGYDVNYHIKDGNYDLGGPTDFNIPSLLELGVDDKQQEEIRKLAGVTSLGRRRKSSNFYIDGETSFSLAGLDMPSQCGGKVFSVSPVSKRGTLVPACEPCPYRPASHELPDQGRPVRLYNLGCPIGFALFAGTNYKSVGVAPGEGDVTPKVRAAVDMWLDKNRQDYDDGSSGSYDYETLWPFGKDRPLCLLTGQGQRDFDPRTFDSLYEMLTNPQERGDARAYGVEPGRSCRVAYLQEKEDSLDGRYYGIPLYEQCTMHTLYENLEARECLVLLTEFNGNTSVWPTPKHLRKAIKELADHEMDVAVMITCNYLLDENDGSSKTTMMVEWLRDNVDLVNEAGYEVHTLCATNYNYDNHDLGGVVLVPIKEAV